MKAKSTELMEVLSNFASNKQDLTSNTRKAVEKIKKANTNNLLYAK